MVIPTYNHAHFLRMAIDSIYRQTFTQWEAIIVNNYSEDDTKTVVESFSDPRIQLVNFRNHGVIAASRNYGISLARGEYISFLDSDDRWYPEKLERSVTVLAKGGDVVCHGEAWIKNNLEYRKVNYGPAKKAAYEPLLFGHNCLSTSAVTVRKSCIDQVGGFDEDPDCVTVEDYDLWLKLSKAGFKFDFIDEILGEYNIHDSNNSHSVLRQLQAELTVLEKHFSLREEWSVVDKLRRRRRLGRVYLACSVRWLLHKWLKNK